MLSIVFHQGMQNKLQFHWKSMKAIYCFSPWDATPIGTHALKKLNRNINSSISFLMLRFDLFQQLLEAIHTYEIDIPKIIHEKSLGLIPKTLSTYVANIVVLSIFGINFIEMSPVSIFLFAFYFIICLLYLEICYACAIQEQYPLIASHLLSGTSLYTVGQLLQVIKTNFFRRFDWGKEKNNLLYGQVINS